MTAPSVRGPADSGHVVVVGDSLVDRDVEGEVQRVCPDSPAPVLEHSQTRSRPGGAALAAVLAAGLARRPPGGQGRVTLVTALCDDGAARELVALVEEAGVRVVPVRSGGTTAEKIRLRSGGHTLVRLDRGSGADRPGAIPGDLANLLAAAGSVLVSDYGRGLAASEPLRRMLAACRRPVVWDPHPLGPAPVNGCCLLTPNSSELLSRWGRTGAAASVAELSTAAMRALSHLGAGGVAVTRGAKGALLVSGDGAPLAVPVVESGAGDACGAGDCFAASVAVHLASGALPSEAVTRGVSDAAAFVAAGGAAAYPRSVPAPGPAGPGPTSAETVAARVRAAGGTIVAAGGCFDLLHAGHVSMLRSARALGDCLIVCLNSDDSVRRLKGPGRPVNDEHDRATTLAALDCVDAVAVFDQDTPEKVIRRLRPDLWVKGGDYDGTRLPEATTLAEWGGQAVVLPYLAGRSTTGILSRAATPTS